MEHILGELRLNGLVSLEREAYEQMDVGLHGKSRSYSADVNNDGSDQQAGDSGATPVDFAALTSLSTGKSVRRRNRSWKEISTSAHSVWKVRRAVITARITACADLIRRSKDIRLNGIKMNRSSI